MKTTLSVRDFALLYDLICERMNNIIKGTKYNIASQRKREKEEATHQYTAYINEDEVSTEDAIEVLINNPTYMHLNSLMNALGELQFEVQTPDVEIKDKP